MVLSAWTKHPSATAVETCKECKLPANTARIIRLAVTAALLRQSAITTTTAQGDVSEKMDKMSLEEEEEDDAKKTKIKTEEKKKKKKEKQKCITITLTSRNKRKTITNVAGFEHFRAHLQDGNLKEVAKTLGKKFGKADVR